MKMIKSFFCLVMVLVLTACSHNVNNKGTLAMDQNMKTVNGVVIIPSHGTLPVNTTVTVTLSDASLADAPSVTLSQEEFTVIGKQSPFPFSLKYKKDQIKPYARIIVSAAVNQGNKLLFSTDTIYNVINNGQTENVQLKLVPVKNYP